MEGIRRLLVFCMLITVVPTILIAIPLCLRHMIYADVAYAVAESDIMEINDGISTIFCSEHTLRMNGTFNAFQMAQRPEVTSKQKHIRLKKSMSLPDDTLEYWGFYLLKGASVALSVCSRFKGASILVVKGERNLRTCGLLEHNLNKEQDEEDMFLPGANRQFKIIYESNAQEIDSKEVTESLDIPFANGKDKPLANASSRNPLGRDLKVSTNTSNSTQEFLTMPIEQIQDLNLLYHAATSYVQKYIDGRQDSVNKTKKRIKRRKKNKFSRKSIQKVKQSLKLHAETAKNVQPEKKMESNVHARSKRSRELIKPPSLLDEGIKHGGNADKNFTSREVSSVSSFESNLFDCYGGAILLAHEFEPSNQCINISYLLSSKHAQAIHHVEEDGYYYYIFYSDNDIVSNDIYAIFDIYKPTFQYENVTNSCINQTECTFSLSPLSADRVIVEIPTKDGIEHDEADDVNILVSICQPRMNAYMVFPIAVLLIILGLAFM